MPSPCSDVHQRRSMSVLSQGLTGDLTEFCALLLLLKDQTKLFLYTLSFCQEISSLKYPQCNQVLCSDLSILLHYFLQRTQISRDTSYNLEGYIFETDSIRNCKNICSLCPGTSTIKNRYIYFKGIYTNKHFIKLFIKLKVKVKKLKYLRIFKLVNYRSFK